MQKGPNGSSLPGDRSLTVGGNEQRSLTPSTSSHSPFNTSYTMVKSIDGVIFSEGDLLLQALNGFVLVTTGEGSIFYTSPTIQNYLGFHQSDVLHQSVYELIHADDRALFRRQLHFALNLNPGQLDNSSSSLSEHSNVNASGDSVTYDPQHLPPENSSFLERTFTCRFRCLLDNSSGFLAMNFRGRLKYVHGQNTVSEDGTVCHPQLALFAIATPLQPPSILEIRSKTLLFQTKHKLDFTPLGIDTRGKVVLGYSEIELCMKGSGYQFIHVADMMHCADNHLRMIKTGNTGFTVFRLLAKSGEWVWVQANARLVFKGGKPDFIVVRQRALTNEEGEEQLRLRRLQVPFTFAKGEAVLYNVGPTLDIPNPCPAPAPAPAPARTDEPPVDPDSLLGCMLRQDHTVYCQSNSARALSSLDDVAFTDTRALVSVPGDTWQPPRPKPSAPGLMAGEGAGEGTVQDMMETLQQILGDSDLRAQMEVEPAELKDWENVLLKMSSSGAESSEDLDEILSNDILLYVEEQLMKEGGIPACLSGAALLNSQNPLLGSQQGFSQPVELQVLPNGGQMLAGKQIPVPGTMKLSHMGSQMASMQLNGPTLQHIASQSTFTPSVGLQTEYNATGSLGTSSTFSPALVDYCAQTQNRFRSLQITTTHNNFGLFPPRQTAAGQGPSMVQPIQHPHLPRCGSSNPNSNPTNNFVDAYSNNISNEPRLNVDSSPSDCLRGNFTLQTHNGPGQSWSLQQQCHQLPAPTLDGHQNMNRTMQFQHNSLPRGEHPQTPESPMLMFTPSNVPTMAFSVQQEMETPPLVSSNSCMFGSGGPVNEPRLGQGMNPASSHPSSSEVPCYFQGLPGNGSLEGGAVLPQDDAGFRPLSCQMTPGLSPDDLLVQQQPYLSFSEQSQIPSHPIIRNEGFPFPSLPSGNPFYSKNK